MRKYQKEVDIHLYDRIKLQQSTDKVDKQWSQIIETIIEKYEGKEMGNLIRYKYQMKLQEKEICARLNIEPTTYYVWCNKLRNEITLHAAYERLIKPF